jgi:hypothetical protein
MIPETLKAIQTTIDKVARDIGTVREVAQRRTIFSNEFERQEHQQMLRRLEDWRVTLHSIDVLALLAERSAERETTQEK